MNAQYKSITSYGDIVVHNNFQPNDPLSWAYAITSAMDESVALFDHKRRLVLYNNRFRTLDKAQSQDLVDLYSIFRYYNNYYHNTEECLRTMERCYNTRSPERFTMRNHAGWIADCKAFPVLENYRLSGVALIAHKRLGSTIQNRVGGHQRDATDRL